MSKKITAAETIEALANQYRAMVEAAEMLKQIGSLENAAAEATRAAEAARAERDAAVAEASEAKAASKKAKDQVVSILAKADADATETRNKAVSEREGILAEAENHADELVRKARVEAGQELSGVTAKKASMTKDIETLQGKMDELVAGIASKTAEVADLEKRLEKAQAQVAKLLG